VHNKVLMWLASGMLRSTSGAHARGSYSAAAEERRWIPSDREDGGTSPTLRRSESVSHVNKFSQQPRIV
jgi:hypothetical protein